LPGVITKPLLAAWQALSAMWANFTAMLNDPGFGLIIPPLARPDKDLRHLRINNSGGSHAWPRQLD
jgi:hypothetical protein